MTIKETIGEVFGVGVRRFPKRPHAPESAPETLGNYRNSHTLCTKMHGPAREVLHPKCIGATSKMHDSHGFSSADGHHIPTVDIVSADGKLTEVLQSALRPDFNLVSLPERELMRRLSMEDLIDAVIVDIDGDEAYQNSAGIIVDELLGRQVNVIIMADDEHREAAARMVERGAFTFVRKPPALREIRTALRKICTGAVNCLDFGRRAIGGTTGLDQLVGSGAQMQLVYKLIRKVANLDASVLITGESGTGKELIARAIHNLGSRFHRPFIAVSCGAIPETLIESELFGHERGAFTGAAGARAGYFEEAADGTLFLDEIGELNLQTQVKLLRVLQERAFNRLGSGRLIPLRARVILATHRDLEQMVGAGQFRSDLFYRINVMNIKAPALREHPEDIPLLVTSFIRKYSEVCGKPIDAIEPEALAVLQVFPWHGNVRELENAVQHAIVMAESRTIQITDLPEQFAAVAGDDLTPGSFERLVRDYKIRLATEAIEQCHGNKTLAAQNLNISRAYLHRLIRLSSPPSAEEDATDISTGRERVESASSGS
jgi:DNA-binding NtrC family response regulator